ncbi:hypothetical protein [Streptomyces pinistramenti]|uniref:hypothetical protein n=1 Tax=Streptomyces pinistramenti TaxID=2884812 RepID=UPI001D07F5B0|nr:hypothetical protein [Streptomyces pinistramenti]MCB5908154.1 hypothetical protein [Streptomyces pinistramenti]
MESPNGPGNGSDRHPDDGGQGQGVSVVQLICRAYGLADASEITVEHINRYVTERRLIEEHTHHIRGRLRPRIPRPRAAGDAA